jgi:hypothetical protein
MPILNRIFEPPVSGFLWLIERSLFFGEFCVAIINLIMLCLLNTYDIDGSINYIFLVTTRICMFFCVCCLQW